jgi:hypothetical protein
MTWYVHAYGATVDADILESELLTMMMHEHDRFFQMVEDYLSNKGTTDAKG